MKLKFASFTAFLLMACSLSAQTLATWIVPQNVTTNRTLLLAQNQIFEVLTLSLDNSSALDITVDDQTLVFGTGGNKFIPPSLVVAGPATITLRRPTGGDEGSLLTFRVVQIERPSSANPQPR